MTTTRQRHFFRLGWQKLSNDNCRHVTIVVKMSTDDNNCRTTIAVIIVIFCALKKSVSLFPLSWGVAFLLYMTPVSAHGLTWASIIDQSFSKAKMTKVTTGWSLQNMTRQHLLLSVDKTRQWQQKNRPSKNWQWQLLSLSVTRQDNDNRNPVVMPNPDCKLVLDVVMTPLK